MAGSGADMAQLPRLPAEAPPLRGDSSPADRAVSSLRAHGFAVVSLPSDEAAVLGRCVVTFHTALQQEHRRGVAEGRSLVPTSCDLPGESTQATLRLAAFAERAQLRYEPNASLPSDEASSPLEEAAKASAQILSLLLCSTLSSIHESGVDAPLDGARLLDAFYYPGDNAWRAMVGHERPLPTPCPAHEDVGMLTVVMDNANALEVKMGDDWSLVPLTPGECALIVGRQLDALTNGEFPACMHRVRPLTEQRTSLTFEVRCDEKAANRAAAAESARALAASNENFVRATSALSQLTDANHSSRCAVM
ncbi:hypothetical protein AB1Y20_023167 [Prymnesium parvum]|uniref:Fe2OG dioxygenase domain-containing protein n=1 Tax=Prymnesium parvum TaxID=97485 RepID=A0AB34JDL3_PRYPA